MRPIYLDFNATTPVKPPVIEAVTAALDIRGNPSSVHCYGRRTRQAVEDARERVAALVNADPGGVIFTSGGTEANNLVVSGGDAPVLVSVVEHDSVLAGIAEANRISVDPQGRIRLDVLRGALATVRPALVSVMLSNNETGVIQPVREAAEIAHAGGALIHCDAVQAAGKVPLDMAELGVDYLTLSAHKIGGPAGVGALIVRGEAPVVPAIRGGGQERGRRAGTENIPGIVGFGAAAELAIADIADQPRQTALRDRLEAAIAATAPDARFHGADAARVGNTSCIGMPGMRNETQVMAFDLAGIAVSAGAACSSGKVGPSHVLRAMGIAPDEAACAIRVSLGWSTIDADVDGFVEAWTDLYRRMRTRVA